MMKSEALIRSILGPGREDVRPLAYAVEITSTLLFVQKIPMDDIFLTKQVYPAVAAQLDKKVGAVSKSVERLANRCWDYGDPDLLEQIIGRRLRTLRSPGEMLFYLAYYCHLGQPFYIAIENTPTLLF